MLFREKTEPIQHPIKRNKTMTLTDLLHEIKDKEEEPQTTEEGLNFQDSQENGTIVIARTRQYSDLSQPSKVEFGEDQVCSRLQK
ncbi:hypothetical protein CHS0354_033051 [Potamilus streckersoni]|uniref:Uncharacterized protein n=1 Tax=Potamilus streckersoni TaxID=2493646 RepID=A0AAE0VKU4_9BIVA|nr:hypothetical protein CHS0354_033051 [Potamilus streckersoni]